MCVTYDLFYDCIVYSSYFLILVSSTSFNVALSAVEQCISMSSICTASISNFGLERPEKTSDILLFAMRLN